jgi:hypothetical protein
MVFLHSGARPREILTLGEGFNTQVITLWCFYIVRPSVPPLAVKHTTPQRERARSPDPPSTGAAIRQWTEACHPNLCARVLTPAIAGTTLRFFQYSEFQSPLSTGWPSWHLWDIFIL